MWRRCVFCPMKEINIKKVIILAVIGLFLVIAIFNSFTIVATGETGVLVRFGQVQEEALASGIHFKIPFVDSVRKVNNKQIELCTTRTLLSRIRLLRRLLYGFTAMLTKI